MKRIILLIFAMVLFAVPVYADSITSDVCVLTFTNITTTSQVATSCIGKCRTNTNCAIEVVRGETLQVEWIASAITHTATDWDVEVWTSDKSVGPFKRYTDALTDGDAVATIGVAADTRFDVTNTSGSIMRYTWDETGTDPTITATDPAPGSVIVISGFATANNGAFIVQTAQGDGAGGVDDYFEITNASGIAEANIVPGAASIDSDANATSLTAGSMGITTGSNYAEIKISENGALRVDGTVTVTVRR